MFDIPIEEVTKPIRQKGKVATLALGYGGGVNALIAMGALKMGLTEEELPSIVRLWRDSNPNIVNLWSRVEDAAKTTIETKTGRRINRTGLSMFYEKGTLFVKLPSGRFLSYYNARLYDDGQIVYEGVNSVNAWGDIGTWGGKLVENIVQAIARDCLSLAVTTCHDHGLKVVFHVHDEIIIEVRSSQADKYLEKLKHYMTINKEPWQDDNTQGDALYLPAAGYTCPYYMKD